jgi:F-type H+-transporting ATPase subunit epsilon
VIRCTVESFNGSAVQRFNYLTMATLKLEIVTPEAKVFSDDVDMVTLTGLEGEMGILPQHMPLMTQLVAGEIIVNKTVWNNDIKENEIITFYLAVGDGFVQVTGDRVSVLTDMAINAENIDEAKAEEARRRAEVRLAEKVNDEEAARIHAALTHATAQLRVKRRHRK